MKKIIVTKDGIEEVDMTQEEIDAIESGSNIEEPPKEIPIDKRVEKLEEYLDEHEAALIEIMEIILGVRE